jgi:hypothetical protein
MYFPGKRLLELLLHWFQKLGIGTEANSDFLYTFNFVLKVSILDLKIFFSGPRIRNSELRIRIRKAG